MQVLRNILLVLPFLLLVLSPAAGQGIFLDDDHPLLELMALIPDTVAVRDDIVYYTDWRAAEAVLPGVPTPTSYAQWEAQNGTLFPYLRFIGAPGFQFLGQYGRMPEVVGFDFFDIDRTLSAGAPPSQLFIFAGEFDVDVITGTLTSRDEDADGPGQYEAVTINDVEFLCWVGGCENGAQQDLGGREPANIFDPSGLGRNPPLILTEDAMVFSFTLPELMIAGAAMTGDTPSLAEADDYRALAEPVTSEDAVEGFGQLVQAQFLPASDLRFALDFNDPMTAIGVLGPQITPEQVEAAAEEMLSSGEFSDYGTLPGFQLAMFADFHGEAAQTAAVALAYDNEDDAAEAAAELTTRLETFSDVITRPEQSESLISERGGTMNEPMVVEASNGIWIAIASANYPPPDLEANPPTQPGLIYRNLVSTIFRRSFYPLWDVTLPE